MKIKIWGTRGSIPSPLKPEQVEEKICQAIYGMPHIDTNDMEAVREHVSELPPLLRGTAGGNTPCVEVQSGEQTIIIDAGSGIRDLGWKLMEGPWGQGQGTLHLFFSHAHWDHIQGFPFFAPAFVPGNKIFIYSVHNMHLALHEQQRPLNFPVALERMTANIQFIHIEPGQPFTIGKVRVNSILNPHPGDAYSYRFDDDHSSFVYASDSEYKELKSASVQPHIQFFQDADALVFDAQYTLQEAWQKVDWGHSSAMIGVDLARTANVKRLILFHHNPSYSDAQLQQIQLTAIAYQSQDPTRPRCEVIVAYEGLSLDLTPPGSVELHLLPETETAVLTPTSVFDEYGVGQLAHQLAGLTEQDPVLGSIIDLSHVETLSTASLKSLVALCQDRENGSIVLAGPSSAVLRVIRLGGYLDFFAIYPNVNTATAALQARKALNLPGQLIQGRYRIENKIGQGPFGTVLEATDIQQNCRVAVKILAASFSQETIARFTSHAEQLLNLDHRNTVKVFDIGQAGDFTYVVEAFIPDQTLDDFLSNPSTTLSADQALDIALDVTLALEYAHSRGVTHGDLKPQNIFLTSEGAKLSGIGLGRLEESHNLLEVPLINLTAPYLAPEQILGHPIDARTDLYALGVLLYQLFTGRLPFSGDDWEVMQAHLHQTAIPPREFNPDISPSLEHLILKLLVNNPNARYASAERARLVSSSLIVNVGESKLQRKGPLIGRQKQLLALQACWDEASAGRGQLVFITGEPGIGKTSLAQEVSTQCAPPILLMGHCLESEGSPAYHPFSEALRAYFSTVPPEFFDDEATHLISNFIRLVPEVRQVLPDLPEPTPLEPKQEQLRLISNLSQFIKRATADRPWLLILDDLQWVDRNSLELLRYLGHHLSTMALFIIGTYRDTELERGHPLQEVLRDLSSYPTYRRFALGRLDQADVNQVLVNIWNQPAPTALAEKIFQHTGGNPFYVEEVARTLVEDGLIILQEGQGHFPALEDVRLPKSVREAVWRRFQHLSPDTQELLRQAAILGQTFKFEDLWEMSGLSEWEVLEHLDVALARQLLKEVPTASKPLLCFSHAEIQSVLYADMGNLRRRMLHHRAGEALARRAMPEPQRIAEELAYHFCQADEFEKALVYSIQAAQQAKAAYANDTALLWYHKTLEMLDQLDPGEASPFYPLRLPVHQYLGEVLTLVGRYDEALEHYAAARNLVENRPLTTTLAHQLADLCCRTAEVHEKRSEYDTAFTWIEKGINYLGQDEVSNEAARIYLIGARTFDHQGKLEQAMEWCQKSLIIAAQVKTDEGRQTMAEAYARLSAICLLRGNFDLAVPFCQESIQVYETIGDLAGQVSPYIYLGMAHYYQGDWHLAVTAYAKALNLADEIGDIDGQSRASNNLANIHLKRGEWNEAMSLYRQNLTVWKQMGMVKDEAKTLSKLAQVYMYQESWAEARACLARSQTMFIEVGSDDYFPELERRWGEFFLKTGELNMALAHTLEAIALAQQQQHPLEEGIAQRLLGQIHLARKENQLAQTALTRSLEILQKLHSSYEVAKAELCLAHILLDNHLLESAKAHLDRALKTFTALNAHADIAQAEPVAERLKRA